MDHSPKQLIARKLKKKLINNSDAYDLDDPWYLYLSLPSWSLKSQDLLINIFGFI